MSGCLLCRSSAVTVLFRGSDRLYATTVDPFSVVRCDSCGLLRLDPVPSPEDLRGYYPGNYWFSPDDNAASRLEQIYRRIVLRDHVSFVERTLRRCRVDGPMLDVGCGGGLLLGLLRERGWRVLGLDFSAEAAAIAWRKQRVPAVCALLTDAPFRRRFCAVVSLFHVLEHLEDPRPHLASARDLLRDGGRLIVQVPNVASWQYRLFGDAWNGLDIPRHLFDFRASDLERLLDDCGFEVVRRKHFSLRDNPAGFATSLAPWLDPMARRIRRVPESGGVKLAKSLIYLAMVSAAVPFALLEAAFHSGATIMVEARKR